MSRSPVLLTRRLPPETMAALSSQVDLRCNPHDRTLTAEELCRMVHDVEGMIATLNDRIDADVFTCAPRLRVVANFAVGYNNIDLAAAAERGVIVTNTPGVLTDATADLTWALILAVARRIGEGERLIRSGTWTGWSPTQLLGVDLRDLTLGIVGMGRIGRAVARRATGFGVGIVYAARRPVDDTPAEWRRLSVAELLSTADIVSLHLPLTQETHHVIGRGELARMKRTAYLINTARGPIVDEAALVEALDRGLIAGAGLDVYEHEPSVHPGLMNSERVVILPHLGSATQATRERMGAMVIANLMAVLEGKTPPHPVRT